MVKNLHVSCFLFLYSLIIAQASSYFEKYISWRDIHNGYRIVYDTNEKEYYICGSFKDKVLDQWGGYSLLMNQNGDVIETTEFLEQQHKYEISLRSIVNTSNKVALVGFTSEHKDGSKSGSHLILIDKENEFIEERELGSFLFSDGTYDFTQTGDNGYLLAGEIFPVIEGSPDLSEPYLIKVDVQGNQLWDTTYHYPAMPLLEKYKKYLTKTSIC